MRNFKVVRNFLLTLLLILPFNNGILLAQVREDIFIDQAWLLENIDHEDLVILHVGSEEDYNTGHLPGARLIRSTDFSVTREDLRWELPERNEFREVLESKGISNRSTIVLYYGTEEVAPTFRLYFTLSFFGLGDNTRILDGGISGWYINGLETEFTVPGPPESGRYLFLYSSRIILADKYDVIDQIRSGRGIVDARRQSFYTGENSGDGYYKRPGHIPTAVNITWTTLFDRNTYLLPEEQLRSFFAQYDPGADIISYCHVGLRASVIFTIGKYLGYQTRLYDGSFNEWDRLDEEYPVEK